MTQHHSEARIVVRNNGVVETDETGEPRQYAVVMDLTGEGFYLRALPRSQYGDDVKIMDVASQTYTGVLRV